MKKLLIIVLACYGLHAGAQVHPSENFVYLYSDSVIYARNVKLRPDFFNSLQLRADSRRIPLEQVKFFNNENGFFANTRKLNFGRNIAFAERIQDGKINVFQLIAYETITNDLGYWDRQTRREPVSIQMYYNKGYADLKKVNYSNLKVDMAGNAQSLDFLEGYRKSMRLSKIFYTTAGASVIASLVTFLVTGSQSRDIPEGNWSNGQYSHPNYKSANFTASFALLGLGAGLGVVGYTQSASAQRHLEEAVDVYNR